MVVYGLLLSLYITKKLKAWTVLLRKTGLSCNIVLRGNSLPEKPASKNRIINSSTKNAIEKEAG